MLAVGGLLAAVFARSEQLSMIMLNTEAWKGPRIPSGWQVKVNHGEPEISVTREGDGQYLRLKSHSSSYGLERGVDIDLAQFPYLTWNWKVAELPRGGDFRRSRTDDQAAQVLVAFSDRRVLTYIWDTSAPKGAMQSTSSTPLLHIFAVVCESGTADVNRWVHEVRNVRDDYQRAFGRDNARIKGIRLQINSQHTGTSAESYFGEVSFRSTPQ